jgi:hypothetical protein
MKKYYKFEIEMISASILSLLLLFPFFISPAMIEQFDLNKIICALIILVLWLMLHELLHGIAYFINGTKLSNITYGIALEKGVFYCLTKQEISKKGVCISLLTPFFIIGVITYIISLIYNLPILWFLSIMNISGASADILMFIYISTIKGEVKYKELDDPTTFVLITDTNIEKKLPLGVKLKEVGDYPSTNLDIKDHRKIIVSKQSWIIIILFLILIGLVVLFK